MAEKKQIAILASGSGSNAENLIHYFKGHTKLTVALIITNNANAGVIERAKRLNVPVTVMSRASFNEGEAVLEELKKSKIDFVVLAGFLQKIPVHVIQHFPNRILNIHPALLPKFGGKGMYGNYVHEAVIKAKEKTSGITIHLVNENYDEGKIIHQSTCEVTPQDTPQTLAQKVHELEYRDFPKVVEQYILEISKSEER